MYVLYNLFLIFIDCSTLLVIQGFSHILLFDFDRVLWSAFLSMICRNAVWKALYISLVLLYWIMSKFFIFSKYFKHWFFCQYFPWLLQRWHIIWDVFRNITTVNIFFICVNDNGIDQGWSIVTNNSSWLCDTGL